MGSFGIKTNTAPHRHRVFRWPKESDGHRDRPSFTRQPLDYRPSAHSVALAFAEEDIPEDWLHGTPSQVERFIGRVEELEGEGGILARVEEVPGGIEFMISLEAGDLVGGVPQIGSLVKLFTWVETAKGLEKPKREQAIERPRLRAEIVAKTLNEEERAALEQFLIKEGAIEEDNG